MEHKALAAYAPTGRNLAKLHQAEQKAATLEHMYRDEKDPTEYSTINRSNVNTTEPRFNNTFSKGSYPQPSVATTLNSKP